ncbi:hypothetical protein AMJ44_12990 [candidate division WOR-1 bacterium DG_54_3]|uniref:DUF3951 domain-containing protein n=1 Tax=candidate division WOR-1 bacterium DG_54_3 TaxID=1703775 RepID=A0A0S7XPK1_UNCSA|nr:MAG: hypothetical protein AMJ44_12990 [candidate division WOR-1 bacterium DG_54_3]
MPSQNIISLLLVAFIFIIIFVGAFIIVKKRWINKKPTIYSAQFTGQNIYMQFQNRQKKKQDSDGDDMSRFS